MTEIEGCWIPDAWTRWTRTGLEYRRLADGRLESRCTVTDWAPFDPDMRVTRQGQQALAERTRGR